MRRPDRGEPRSGEPEGLASVLERVLAGRPWKAGVTLAGLARRWDEVVGERLAEESEPVRLDGGVLEVAVASAAWGSQLSFLSGEVRRRANEVLSGGADVASVRVVVRPGAGSRKPSRRDGRG